MSTLKTPLTIPKDFSTGNDLDFEFLKRKGIEYIESMGGGLWTDYNEHDPGITMLEMLAYAINDLGNRIDLPIQDLLASPDSNDLTSQFYVASDILPNRAVNALDYRKIMIDLDGVRNCWIMPYEKWVYADCKNGKLSYDPAAFPNIPEEEKAKFKLKGLNKILLDYDLDESLNPIDLAARILEVKENVRLKYHENRNIGEDLIEINEVGNHPISVCTEIELENTADEDVVHANILFAIDLYFSPGVRFYSLSQMIEKGYRPEEIFEGPLLENGFIDTAELRKADLRSEVRLSDLIQIITAIDGVKLIKDITIGNCNDSNSPNDWLICIEKYTKPLLCSKSTFSYRKDVIPIAYDQARVDELLAELIRQEEEQNSFAGQNKELEIPQGEYLETDFYTTIQNDFPDVYGIGEDGLNSTVDTARKSQAKQLKAYLLFFDQILASYFSHLGKVKELLSVDNHLSGTYFTQAVEDLTGLNEIVDNYPEHDNIALSEQLFDGLDNSIARRNQLLDHLLARFAEKFSEYSFLMKELYGSMAADLTLNSKEVFLREYVELSSNRGRSFDYYEKDEDELWDTGNVSGAEKRIARLAGMKNYFRRDLTDSYAEIYKHTDLPDPVTFKWRIKNNVPNTVLCSVRTYTNITFASNQLYQAVLLLIETDEKAVKKAFDTGFTHGMIVGNIKLLKSGSGKYYFEVINKELPEGNPEYIVAKQFIYYNTLELFEEGILRTIAFMKYDFTEEGMFMVEHILLRPNVENNAAASTDFLPICADDCTDSCSIDPYSFRVSIVLPGYTQRFGNMDFRLFMEELIQEELPAHVLAKICWIGYRKDAVPDVDNELLQFQKTYKAFLKAKSKSGQVQKEPEFTNFKKVLINLNSIYPTGKLYDCTGDSPDGKIILGRTALGTLSTSTDTYNIVDENNNNITDEHGNDIVWMGE